MSAELSQAAESRVSMHQHHREHNQRHKRSSGVLDFCKQDDKEPHDLAACPLSTAASWGAWAQAQERQDKGLL